MLPPLPSPVAKNFFLPPLLNWRRSEGCDSDPEWRIKAFKKKKYQDSRLGAPHGSSVGHRASTSALEEAWGNPTTSSKAYPRHDDGSFTDGCEYFIFFGYVFVLLYNPLLCCVVLPPSVLSVIKVGPNDDQFVCLLSSTLTFLNSYAEDFSLV